MGDKRGFALSEMLITVAIITILTAIAIVGVATVSANMNSIEVNDAAKEIYVASQNKLLELKEYSDFEKIVSSEDFAAGEHMLTAPSDFEYWREKSGYGSDIYDNYVFGESGNMYCINSFDETQRKTIDTYFLPYGSVIEDILEGDFYIEYNIDTGTVYGVVYLEDGQHIAYQDIIAALDDGGRENESYSYTAAKANRNNYEYDNKDAPIGYYGGAITSELNTYKLEEPEVSIINDEDLILSVIKDEENDSKVEVELTGKTSGEKATFFIEKDSEGRYEKILDSLLLHGGENKHFAYQFPKFYSGEDIEVRVAVRPTNEYLAVSRIRVLETNTLFESVSDKVAISSIRHLENLDKKISGLSCEFDLVCKNVVLTRDISFSGYGDGVGNLIFRNYCKEGNICTYNNTEKEYYGAFSSSYYPVENMNISSFDGNGHNIYDIYINLQNEKNQGLFSKVGNIAISNLGLIGSLHSEFAFNTPTINCIANSNINIGGFVGYGICASFKNCFTTMSIDCPSLIDNKNANKNVGGFVGCVEDDLSISNSYISGEADKTGILKDGIKVSIQGDNDTIVSMGGFVGCAGGNDSVVKIENSYCVKSLYVEFDSDELEGLLYEGGFIGRIRGEDVDVLVNDNSYFAAALKSNIKAILSNSDNNDNVRFGGIVGGFAYTDNTMNDTLEKVDVDIEGRYVDYFADFCGVPGSLVYGNSKYPEIPLLSEANNYIRNNLGKTISISKLCKRSISADKTYPISEYYLGKAYSFPDPTGLGHHYGDWQIKEYGASVEVVADYGIESVLIPDGDEGVNNINYGGVIDLDKTYVENLEGYEGACYEIESNKDGSDGVIVETSDGRRLYIAGVGTTKIRCKATGILPPNVKLTGGGEFVYGYKDVVLNCESTQKYAYDVNIEFGLVESLEDITDTVDYWEGDDVHPYKKLYHDFYINKRGFYGTRYCYVCARVTDGVFTSCDSFSNTREVILSRVRINFNENNTGKAPYDAKMYSQKYAYVEFGSPKLYTHETGTEEYKLSIYRTNHDLLGWSADTTSNNIIMDWKLISVGDSRYMKDGNFTPTETSDIDLYAIWEKYRCLIVADSGDGWFYD